jgi:Spy/CpxP family protein refolding chaperone
MKRRKVALSLMAGLVVCSLGAVAASKTASHGDDGGPLRMFIRDEIGKLKKFYSDLDVTQEQREKIRDVLKEHRSEIVAVARPIVEKRRALREAVLAKNPDDDAIRAAANSLGKAIGDAAVLASKVKPEVGKVLTSEQKEKIEEFRKQNDKTVDEFIEKIGSHS